ncbi:MAG: PEP-utilizing enzyme, partial [Deltaproteobacteria bacterium]
DRLLRGLPGNVTTEMDLAVGDLADLVRPYPDLAAMLRDRPWSEIQTRWADVDGGVAFAAALDAFLVQYGDRAAGEIDLSRPRWRDDPTMLFRVVAGGLSGTREAGAHRRHYATQVAEGEQAQRRLIEAAGRGVFGAPRRWWVGRLSRVARACMGLREHPKFAIVRMLGTTRSEIVAAAATLASRGQLRRADQVWHLGFDELARALDDATLDLRGDLSRREEEFRRDQSRRPPVVMSGEGESPTRVHDRADLPAGALAGTAASSGVVEGIARVIHDPSREVLQAGEILVAPFTDPGWTPLFVQAAAVVTEVGGLMTHGAVVAREYGLPAVVSVAGATTRIRTGQRVRVDGTRGFVQILEDA